MLCRGEFIRPLALIVTPNPCHPQGRYLTGIASWNVVRNNCRLSGVWEVIFDQILGKLSGITIGFPDSKHQKIGIGKRVASGQIDDAKLHLCRTAYAILVVEQISAGRVENNMIVGVLCRTANGKIIGS